MREIEKKLKQFVGGELFDLNLYRELLKIEKDEVLKTILSELVPIEEKHLEFWQKTVGISQPEISIFSKIKLKLFSALRRISGPAITVLIVEMIEIYGIKKYFSVWQEHKEASLAEKLKEILIIFWLVSLVSLSAWLVPSQWRLASFCLQNQKET